MRVAAGERKGRPLPASGLGVAASDHRRLRQVVSEVHGATRQLLFHEQFAVREGGVRDDAEGAAVPVRGVHRERRRHQRRRARHHQFEDFQRLLPVRTLIGPIDFR